MGAGGEYLRLHKCVLIDYNSFFFSLLSNFELVRELLCRNGNFLKTIIQIVKRAFLNFQRGIKK